MKSESASQSERSALIATFAAAALLMVTMGARQSLGGLLRYYHQAAA